MKIFLSKIDSYFLNKFSRVKEWPVHVVFSKIGHFIFCLVVILFFFLIPDIKFREIGILSLFSIAINTIIVFIIKHTVKRERHFKEGFYLNKVDPYSFPSGHISRLAGFILPSTRIPIFILFFIILTFIASVSRMAKGYHYFSDCLFGLFIGLFSGLIVILFDRFFLNLFYLIFSF